MSCTARCSCSTRRATATQNGRASSTDPVSTTCARGRWSGGTTAGSSNACVRTAPGTPIPMVLWMTVSTVAAGRTAVMVANDEPRRRPIDRVAAPGRMHGAQSRPGRAGAHHRAGTDVRHHCSADVRHRAGHCTGATDHRAGAGHRPPARAGAACRVAYDDPAAGAGAAPARCRAPYDDARAGAGRSDAGRVLQTCGGAGLHRSWRGDDLPSRGRQSRSLGQDQCGACVRVHQADRYPIDIIGRVAAMIMATTRYRSTCDPVQ